MKGYCKGIMGSTHSPFYFRDLGNIPESIDSKIRENNVGEQWPSRVLEEAIGPEIISAFDCGFDCTAQFAHAGFKEFFC